MCEYITSLGVVTQYTLTTGLGILPNIVTYCTEQLTGRFVTWYKQLH